VAVIRALPEGERRRLTPMTGLAEDLRAVKEPAELAAIPGGG